MMDWSVEAYPLLGVSKRIPSTIWGISDPVPARLIHRDMKSIRNGVDLLLDDIDFTEPVAKRLFIPAASRPYPELRALLVRD